MNDMWQFLHKWVMADSRHEFCVRTFGPELVIALTVFDAEKTHAINVVFTAAEQRELTVECAHRAQRAAHMLLKFRKVGSLNIPGTHRLDDPRVVADPPGPLRWNRRRRLDRPSER